MSFFIKTENFKDDILLLDTNQRRECIRAHIVWVKNLIETGHKIASGYLVDSKKQPGGGGLLILEAESLNSAITLVKEDPMIISGMVDWHIQEWVPVIGELLN